jgi:hypothetical protein
MRTIERDGKSDAPERARNVLRTVLGHGDALSWAGQPRPWRMAWETSWLHFLMGFPFTGFALYWESRALDSTGATGSATGFFPLIGLLFVGAGLGLLLSPLWAYWKARRTYFGLTKDRAIILTLFPMRSVHSFAAGQLQERQYFERADGSGSIVFTPETGVRWSFRVGWGRHRDSERSVRKVGFLAIENVRDVDQLILAMPAK